ncbi:MAG: hypothetical protein WC289_01300 [Patescibacteria group bacterium]|jgi:hypothetical protein
MNAFVLILLPLIAHLAILYFLSRVINRIAYATLGRGWYLITQWPGVIVHELSHAVACLLTFTRVYEVKLFAPSDETLGYVTHADTKNPFKRIIISTAPLFGSTIVIWLIVKYLMPDLYIDMQSTISTHTAANIRAYAQYFISLFTNIDFTDWRTYVFLYAMIAIASHAAPSKPDMKHALWGIIGVLLLIGLLFGISNATDVDVLKNVGTWIQGPAQFMTAFLAYSIIFSLLALVALFPFVLLKRALHRT